MLTRKQIEKIAARNRIGLAIQERDYIQNIFLYLLYTDSQDLIFKGGTSLHFVYKSPRFSEDLDFNSLLSMRKLKETLSKTVKGLSNFGIEATIRDEREYEGGYGIRLVYKGPLFNGRQMTSGGIRLDLSLRKEVKKVKSEIRMLSSIYDDVPICSLSILTLKEILSEKVRSLIIRGMPRDLYDLWFLLSSGVKKDISLINDKLSLYRQKFSFESLESSINRVSRFWERDLSRLLPYVPPFSQIRKDVLNGFR